MALLKPLSLQAAKAKAWGALWTFPTILFSAFAIGWGAEAAQYFISKGLALAILAWLQTLPEFAVEAVIAWHQDIHLMLANLTGSLRLLVGLGWPLIFFTRACFKKKAPWKERISPIHLDEGDSASIFGLLLPLLYFVWIYLKGSLHFWDGIVLFFLYVIYLIWIQKVPPEEMEELSDMPWVPRKIVAMPPFLRNLSILGLFVGGGVLLYVCVQPFLESMLGLAMVMGISEFVFIQWLSPFLSEFPEKLTAFNWSRREGKAGMALMNMVSSNVNQWTLLVAMMMAIFSYSKGSLSGFEFDEHQKLELALTWVQSMLAFLMLLDMRFRWYEAGLLFCLWFVQFIIPSLREEILWVYGGLTLFYFGLFLAQKRKINAWKAFRALWKPKERLSS